jgi:hypothetical protein
MKNILNLELYSIYGGDGFERIIEIKKPKLKRVKGRKTTKLEISSESSSEEELYEIKQQIVFTFDKNSDGKIIYRIGDKMKGVLKQAGELYADETNSISKAQIGRMLNSCFCTPNEVILENISGIKVASLPQILNNMGKKSMIIQCFDCIEKCNCQVQLVYPDTFSRIFDEMINRIELLPFGNKRRGRIKILKAEANGQ